MADDLRINIEALKINLADMNLLPISKFYQNGQEVIDAVTEVLATTTQKKPLLALLLDFQMPRKNGLQVV